MKDEENVFDDLNALRRQSEEQQKKTTPNRSRKAKRKRLAMDVTYACIPHEVGQQLAKHMTPTMFAVLVELDRLIFEGFGQNPVKLTNYNLKLRRRRKPRALRRLEALGVISVEWNGRGAPIVTHNWFPVTGK